MQRLAIENGKAIFPEVMDEEEYQRLLEEDYWTGITQYANSPRKTGLSEFFSMDIKRAKLHWKDEEWWIAKLSDSNFDDEGGGVVRLGDRAFERVWLGVAGADTLAARAARRMALSRWRDRLGVGAAFHLAERCAANSLWR